MLQFEFLDFFTICVFAFCHHRSFWSLSPFEFMRFITICVFDLHCNLCFWVSSQFEFCSFITIRVLSFITIWVMEFHQNLRFEIYHNLSLSFIPIWVFEFHHKGNRILLSLGQILMQTILQRSTKPWRPRPLYILEPNSTIVWNMVFF